MVVVTFRCCFCGIYEVIIRGEEDVLSLLGFMRGSCSDKWAGRVHFGTRDMSSVSRYFSCADLGLAISNSSSRSSESEFSCVVSLTTIQPYCASISITYFGVFVDANVFSGIYPICGMNALITLQLLGFSLVI